MRTNLKMIAQAASLSLGAISDILNRGRAHLYDPSTVDRVREIARIKGYRPNRAAQALRVNQTKVIGFVARTRALNGDIANHVVYPFIIGASQYLINHRYHVAMVELEELDPAPEGERQPRILDDSFYDGLILQQGAADYSAVLKKQVFVPMVWWDSGLFEKECCIYRKETEVGYRLTRELLDLGHRKIGFPWTRGRWERHKAYQEAMKTEPSNWPVRGPSKTLRALTKTIHFSSVQRYEGYIRAMSEEGLKPLDLIYHDSYALSKLLKSEKPTVLIVDGHSVTPYYAVAAAAGLSIPRDLSLASCDVESRIAEPLEFKLGGITYDRFRAGENAAKMIHRMVDDPALKVPSETITGEFRLGDTILPRLAG